MAVPPSGKISTAFLRSVMLLRDEVPSFERYPFAIPAIRHLDQLELDPKLTFLVGENGTGKSTLMEAIAVAAGFNPEGGTIHFSFETAATHSELHRFVRLARGIRRNKDGFFYRGESYYNVASEIDRMDEVVAAAPKVIESYGGQSLHAQSHGESFLTLLTERLGPNGLYLFDEPEAALSPTRQMTMLVVMRRLLDQGCQLIIATHSPILLGYPEGLIYELTSYGIRQVPYEDTEHYQVTRRFLVEREGVLECLFSEDEEQE